MKTAVLFNLPFATLVLLAIVTAQVAQAAPVADGGYISAAAMGQDCPGGAGHQQPKPAGQLHPRYRTATRLFSITLSTPTVLPVLQIIKPSFVTSLPIDLA
ncbi:hypothetical protein CF319_g5622 [Tilletia indica]|nr:hypothetical protein CF319_g5622 [Tilletia indica]KAE8231920.1 hypothetical protein CF326_g3056 [Tilletia indica]